MMKLKKSILGLALAGALTLCGASPAAAQNSPMDPYYFTPKLLYSYAMYKNFSGQTVGLPYSGTKKNDDTWGGGVAVGYDFGTYGEYPIRLELEYLYRGKTSADYGPRGRTNDNLTSYNITSDIHTVFANAYLDFPTDTAFTPYVQAGLGGAYVDTDFKEETLFNWFNIHGSQAEWNFAWNVGAGLAYQCSDNIALDLSYRYSSFGDGIELKSYGGLSTGEVDLQAHEVILGLRFTGF